MKAKKTANGTYTIYGATAEKILCMVEIVSEKAEEMSISDAYKNEMKIILLGKLIERLCGTGNEQNQSTQKPSTSTPKQEK